MFNFKYYACNTLYYTTYVNVSRLSMVFVQLYLLFSLTTR